MLKSVFRRIRKGIRDIGSFAQDNPLLTAGAAAFGPSLFGMGSPLIDLFKTGIGTLGKKGVYDTALGKMVGGTDPSGLLGIGADIWGDMSGKDKAGIGLGLLNTYLAKRQFDQEKADALRREKEMRDRYDLVSRKFGTYDDPQFTGGTPFVEDMIRGTVYDPKTDKYYDYHGSCSISDYENESDCVANGGTWTALTTENTESGLCPQMPFTYKVRGGSDNKQFDATQRSGIGGQTGDWPDIVSSTSNPGKLPGFVRSFNTNIIGGQPFVEFSLDFEVAVNPMTDD